MWRIEVNSLEKVMSASLTLCNLTSTEAHISTKDVAVISRNYSADRKMCVTHGECRLQLVACWLTHFVAALCPDHSNCLKRECKGRCVFHLFYSIFVRKLEKERSPQDVQVGGGRGGGGWPSRGKVLTREKRRKKTEGAPQKNWVSRVALYVGSHVETWDWAGPLNLHNEAQEQSGPEPW